VKAYFEKGGWGRGGGGRMDYVKEGFEKALARKDCPGRADLLNCFLRVSDLLVGGFGLMTGSFDLVEESFGLVYRSISINIYGTSDKRMRGGARGGGGGGPRHQKGNT